MSGIVRYQEKCHTKASLPVTFWWTQSSLSAQDRVSTLSLYLIIVPFYDLIPKCLCWVTGQGLFMTLGQICHCWSAGILICKGKRRWESFSSRQQHIKSIFRGIVLRTCIYISIKCTKLIMAKQCLLYLISNVHMFPKALILRCR